MNYVLIACDQLRYDTLSINGNSVCQTPNLDQLAREGVNFTNAHTTAPLCSPARASMFTGKYSLTHGMGTNCDMYHALSRELSHPETLLHHKLKQSGYACGYIEPVP
jgi:arylsulfatase A-like enzyme